MPGFFASLGNSLRSLFGGAKDPPATRVVGADGTPIFGGYLSTGETTPELTGRQKWTTYANTGNNSVVAIGVRSFGWLLSGTKWNVLPNKSGSKNAQRGADLVRAGLINAQMPKPWSSVVRKAAMYRWMGSSMHAWTMRRMSDGTMGFASLQHRPMWSITQWDRPDPQGEILGVVQQVATGDSYYLPRNRLLYAVDDTMSDSPDGVGLFRHVVEIVRRLQIVEALELGAFQTDLRGMLIGLAPISELAAQSGSDDAAKVKQYVSDKTADLRNILANSVKDPSKALWLMLDSEPFKGLDQNTISTLLKWNLQLLKGDSNGLPDVAKLVDRLHLMIARVCGFEHVMMGGGNSRGTQAMHGDKTDLMGLNLQATVSELAGFATNDCARPIVAYNGLDADTDTPTLEAEPVAQDSILAVSQALGQLALAGGMLPPTWDGWDVLLERARLPPRPAMTPAMMGMLQRRPPVGTPPDPSKGEEDVPLDDLGATEGKGKAA